VSRIWVAGEVLVDLIPSDDGDTVIDSKRYRAVIGGGPANTAKALARLSQSVEFIGGLSSDRYGHMAWMELERDGVDLEHILESDLPTAKAIVSLDQSGSPSDWYAINYLSRYFGCNRGTRSR
jgi:fructokinase